MTTPKNTTKLTRSTRVRRPRVNREINARLAGEQVGPIEKGMATVGLTKGQWSLSDLVLHVLEATGPADLTVSTWTAAGADLDHTFRLLESD